MILFRRPKPILSIDARWRGGSGGVNSCEFPFRTPSGSVTKTNGAEYEVFAFPFVPRFCVWMVTKPESIKTWQSANAVVGKSV